MKRKMSEKILCSTIILLAFLLSFAAAPQLKIEEQTNTFTFKDLGILLSDDSFKGISTTREYGFQWPSTWEPEEGSTLTLVFSHAKALSEKSSFVIEFNGSHIASVELTSLNRDRGELTVQIPRELWVEGYNRVRLVLYLGYEGFDCMNLDDDLLWFTVHTTSNFTLQYRLKEASPVLNEFPVPFVINSGIIENDVTFILPDVPISAEINAASLISAKLGQFASWRTLNLSFASQSDVLTNPEKLIGNIILVGRVDQLPLLNDLDAPWNVENGRLDDKNGDPYPEDTGVLWSGQFLDNSDQSILVVTGDTDNAVVEAAKALTRDSIIEQLPGNLALINQVPNSVSIQETYTSTFTLEKYQYQDITAWGTSEQTITYSLPFAASWKVIDDVNLRLHFSHSNFSEGNESYITVQVNGTPAGTIPLTTENADDAWQELVIPARLFDFGENLITVVSNINLPDGSQDARYDCLDDNSTAAWIVVYADSEMTVPLGPSTEILSINEFPYAFIGSSDLSDFGIILPDQPNKLIDEMVIRLSEYLGHYINGDGIDLRIYTTGELAAVAEKPTHLMLIGQPTQNSKIAQLNDRLPQPFEDGTNNPVSLNDIVQVNPNYEDIGYLQALIDSDGNPMLIATGTSDEGIGWAVDALMDSDNIKNLYGDLALTRAEGSISSALIQDTEDLLPVVEEIPVESQKEENNLNLWGGIVFAVVTSAVVIGKIIEEVLNKNKSRKHD